MGKNPEENGVRNPSGNVTALASSDNIVNIKVDSEGDVCYDAIVTGGTNSNKKVYSRHSDLLGSEPTKESIALPSKEEEEETRLKTQAAQMSLLETKSKYVNP